MQIQGRHLEVIFPSDTDTDLVDDFIVVITSLTSRIYGQRTSRGVLRRSNNALNMR
jgi:predicted site-specific integrase-resolvase